MKNRKKNSLLYMAIVIVPIFAGFIYYANVAIHHDFTERKEQAIWTASIHKRSWDQFISETVTSLDILSLSAITTQDHPARIEPLLSRISSKEPRYGGIYLLDATANVIAGSNKNLKNSNLFRQDYISEIIKTNDIIISHESEILKNGQKIIGLGKPILNEEGRLLYILVAHLRVDYMVNIMRLLTPDAKLSVINSSNEIMMDINWDQNRKISNENFIFLPIDRLPWSIRVEIPPRNTQFIIESLISDLLKLGFIMHILFLFIKYVMLSRQAAKERKENELKKLELVGTLAASTAHEIRNPLTGIKGLIQLLSEKYTQSEDQYYFSVINDEINRINEITSEFLILGKPTAQITEVMDLRKIILELEPLIKSEADVNKVKYERFLPDTPILVDCVKDQIKQVLLNITKNALESMSSDGILCIDLKKEANQCHLQISDSGIGIDEEDLEKIFQPFYTSKDFGTGLGLVVSKRILQSFGGKITISSKVNFGTTVHIFLPLQ